MRKFACSNAAHVRLMNKHRKQQKSDSRNYDKHFILTNYHSNVLFQQKKKGRILSAQEKRLAYDDVIRSFY